MIKLEINPEPEIRLTDHLIESQISPIHKGGGKLFEIKDNPDKVVRVESFADLEPRYKGRIDPVAVAELGQVQYAELQTRYHIATPVEFLIGKGFDNEDVVYSIVDKVDGKDLDACEVTPELIEQVERLYENIAQYYLDKFSQENGFYLADINNATQYVYGKKKGDSESHIYLVDTDLYLRDGKVALCNVVLWLFRHMASIEGKYGKKLTHAREIIKDILATPLPNGLTEEQRATAEAIIAKTKGYMDGTIVMDDKDVHPIFSDLD